MPGRSLFYPFDKNTKIKFANSLNTPSKIAMSLNIVERKEIFMKLSEIYGKKVLSTTGKEGYVLSVNAAGEKLTCFVCADMREREFTVEFKNIVKFGEKIIYTEGENCEAMGTPLRLGRACFNERGNYLGNLQDFTFFGDKLKTAKIGKKNYPAEGLILSDAVIVGDIRRLKSDVVKDGKTLFKKGTYVTEEVLNEAAVAGEYVQTTLKSI